jgi:hypothetical protein
MDHFPDTKASTLTRGPGTFTLFSPFSVHVKGENDSEPVYEPWNHDCHGIYIEQDDTLQETSPKGDLINLGASDPIERGIDLRYEHHAIETLPSLPSPPLSNEQHGTGGLKPAPEEDPIDNEDEFVKRLQLHHAETEISRLVSFEVTPSVSGI